nr:hypothetical protein Q903MT_gene156 [Picea sitchensis]
MLYEARPKRLYLLNVKPFPCRLLTLFHSSLGNALSLALICLIHLSTALVARLTAIQPGRLLDEERRSSWSLTRTIPTRLFCVVLRVVLRRLLNKYLPSINM